MPTNRNRRTRAIRPPFTDRMRYYLENGDYLGRILPPDSPGRVEVFMLAGPNRRTELRAVWLRHREEIYRDWKMEKRRGKPWAAREFDG